MKDSTPSPYRGEHGVWRQRSVDERSFTMGDSEKRAAALQLQLETRRMFERFKARLEHIKTKETPEGERGLRRRLWWETALAGGGAGFLTFSLLRRGNAGRFLSFLGSGATAHVTGCLFFANRAPSFFENVTQLPTRSPFVDDALCPTLLDFQRIAEDPQYAAVFSAEDGSKPPIAPIVYKMWALCSDRAQTFQAADDAIRADAQWGSPAMSDDDGWKSTSEPTSPSTTAADLDDPRWYTPPAHFEDPDDPAARR